MPVEPIHIELNLTPSSRFELIDVADKIRDGYGDLLEDYSKVTCCSLHTTAGYPEQQLCAEFEYSHERLYQFIETFQRLFPPNAGYFHDTMELREELNERQKEREPANADSHLTFISAGLKNCVTYLKEDRLPIYFVDLDGVHGQEHRNRRTIVMAYNKEKVIYDGRFSVPVGGDRPINSFNLKDPCFGLFDYVRELLDFYGIDQGQVEIRLAREERHAALTVNEYETLLMRNDLPEALGNPLGYMIRHAKKWLQDPASIPAKARGYAVYDLIHLYNELVKNMVIGRSILDKALSYLSSPVSRLFQLKRDISLLVSGSCGTGLGSIFQGTYQSPILLQYLNAANGVRCLEITLKKFE